MNKYKQLGKNTLLVFIGNAGSRLIGILMLPFYTRWLDPEKYGTVDIINTYALLLIGFIVWCIADAIFVIPKNGTEEEKKSYFTTGWIFSILGFGVTALLFYVLDIVFKSYGIENSFASNLWYIYFVMLGTFVQQYTQQFTRCIDKMGVYSVTGIIHTLFLAVFSLIFIPKNGVKGYISAYVIAYILSSIFSFVASGSYKYIALSKARKESLIELLKYSIPLIPNAIMWWLVSGMNKPIIEAYIGMEANGILAVANRIPGIIGMLSSIFTNAWVISMMEEYGKPGFIRFFSTVTRCVILISILASIILAIFIKQVIMIFADASYIDAYKYAPICVMAALLSNFSSLIGGIFAARKESKYFFYSSFWAGMASVLFMFLLIPPFGLYGATIGTCISFGVGVLSRYIYAKNDLKGFQIIPIIFSFSLYGIITAIVPINLSLWVKCIIYLAVILSLIWINRDIINTLISKFSISLCNRKKISL